MTDSGELVEVYGVLATERAERDRLWEAATVLADEAEAMWGARDWDRDDEIEAALVALRAALSQPSDSPGQCPVTQTDHVWRKGRCVRCGHIRPFHKDSPQGDK